VFISLARSPGDAHGSGLVWAVEDKPYRAALRDASGDLRNIGLLLVSKYERRAILMRLTFLLALTMLLASIGVRGQSSVAGTWSDSTLRLVLHTNGETLTGTVKDGRSATHAIANGIVDGRTLRFTTDAKLNDKDVIIQWNGELTGDELSLTRVIPSDPPKRPYPPFNGPFVLHRSN
jgi:hypothetical protein